MATRLTAGTKVFLVNKNDGHLWEMTLDGWFLSMKGGSRWEEVEVMTEHWDAQDAAEKYKKIANLRDHLSRLDPAMAIPAAEAMLRELNERRIG